MNVVLFLLIINHLIYLAFCMFIEGVMGNSQTSDSATGYGMFYAFLIFPIQVGAEIGLVLMFFYQLLIVRKWQANPVLWVIFTLTILSFASLMTA